LDFAAGGGFLVGFAVGFAEVLGATEGFEGLEDCEI